MAALPAQSDPQHSRIVTVLDGYPGWENTRGDGHTVQVVAPADAVPATLRDCSHRLLNLAAPGAIGVLDALQAAESTKPTWAYLAAPDSPYAVPLGPVEASARPIDSDAIVNRLRSRLPRDGRILVVGSDAATCFALRPALTRQGWSVAIAWDARQAADTLPLVRPNLVVVDLADPARGGHEVVLHLASADPAPAMLLLPGQDDEALFLAVLERMLRAAAICPRQSIVTAVLGMSDRNDGPPPANGAGPVRPPSAPLQAAPEARAGGKIVPLVPPHARPQPAPAPLAIPLRAPEPSVASSPAPAPRRPRQAAPPPATPRPSHARSAAMTAVFAVGLLAGRFGVPALEATIPTSPAITTGPEAVVPQDAIPVVDVAPLPEALPPVADAPAPAAVMGPDPEVVAESAPPAMIPTAPAIPDAPPPTVVVAAPVPEPPPAVTLEPLHPFVRPSAGSRWTVQIMATRSLETAEAIRAALASRGFAPRLESAAVRDETWHRVLVGDHASRTAAERAATALAAN